MGEALGLGMDKVIFNHLHRHWWDRCPNLQCIIALPSSAGGELNLGEDNVHKLHVLDDLSERMPE